MSKHRIVRVGVIGLGRFGNVHARVFSQLGGCELAALCTRNPERLAAAAAEFQVDRVFSDYRRLLETSDIDAVSIVTHWRDHLEIALAALSAGKHVLLEKPMAGDFESCRKLVEAAKASAGIFMVGHVCRFDPRVTLAKAAIDEGRIGRVVAMRSKRNLPIAPGHVRLNKISPLMGDGVHDADLMMWFSGRTPHRVYGRATRVRDFDHPDFGWATLEFGKPGADEATGVIEVLWGLPENVPTVIDAQMEIVGTEGLLTIDCAHPGLTILDESGVKMPDTAYWPIQHGRHIGALSHELAYFVDCARHHRPADVITPEEAALAVKVIERAELSAQQGQPVSVD